MALIETALKLIDKNGFTITLNNYTANPVFNVDLGENVKVIDSTIDTKGVYSKFDSIEFQDKSYTIQEGDKKLLVAVENFNINAATKIVIDNKTYAINDLKEVKQGSITVLYKLIIRANKG